MDSVRFEDVVVLGAYGPDLEFQIHTRRVLIPRILVGPGSDVGEPGDRGKLVIQRWLAIGLGLVSPFLPPALPFERGSRSTSRD